jgi:tetratricopeptide (TPR) repeat protein
MIQMQVVAHHTSKNAQEHGDKNRKESEHLHKLYLKKEQDNPDELHHSGVIAYQNGQYELAIELINKAIDVRPSASHFYNTLGIVFEALGNYEQAIIAYRRALSIRPDYADAYHNMAIALQSQGQYVAAVNKCKQALSFRPNDAHVYNTMAFSLEKQQLYKQAIDNYQRAIQLKPDFVEAYNHLGVVLNKQGRSVEASENFKTALSYDPDYAEVYSNLGIALKEQEQFSEAIASFKQALQLDPDFAEAYYNLANSLRDEGCCREAINHYKKAIHLKPDYAQAHWNLSLTHLLCGNYIEGWSQYRWRRNADLKILTDYHCTGKLRWDGSSFKNQRLLVHYEQGLGDNIQFVRYLPMAKARGGTVIFETLKPLIGLLQGFPGIDELIEYNPGKICSLEYDVYTSLLDMPNIFTTTVETIPVDVPYIFADPVKSEYWRNRISGPGYKVGIVWAGSPEHGNDRYRSCSLRDFAPLMEIDNLQLYGLQKGRAADQMDELAGTMPVINISKYFDDLTDTAAVIESLDLVISVDTCVLHLSGAMGKPTWALLPYAPEWRWMLNRQDSPWYPGMKLFRQKRWRDWNNVFQCVAGELQNIVKNKGCELRK